MIYAALWTVGRKWLVGFNAGKIQLVLTVLITPIQLIWKWMGETFSKKIAALIRSVKFLSPKVALCHYKFTIQHYME